MAKRKIEIMDTTLRDGEQTSGVSFSVSEKLTIAKLLLEELKVDRIEIASARVSDGELKAVQKITNWATEKGFIDKVEVLTFVDGGASIKWMEEAGAKVQNLLTKGSLNHLTHQLKKTPEQHFSEIKEVIALAKKEGIETNVYFEDWSNGMRNSEEYVMQFLDFLSSQPVKRILLPDTLGVLTPNETYTYFSKITAKYPSLHFDFHAHNDYDLSVANVMESIKDDFELSESVVNERKVTIKRQYTENHPAITVGKHAKIRNTILEAIKDGEISQDEFDAILKEMSSDSKRWLRLNCLVSNCKCVLLLIVRWLSDNSSRSIIIQHCILTNLRRMLRLRGYFLLYLSRVRL